MLKEGCQEASCYTENSKDIKTNTIWNFIHEDQLQEEKNGNLDPFLCLFENTTLTTKLQPVAPIINT